MTIFVADLVFRQNSFVREESIRFARGLGQTLAANGVSWLMMHDYAGLQEIVASQSQFSNLKVAMVFSMDGKILAHTEASRIGHFLEESRTIPDLLYPHRDLKILEDSDSVYAIVPIVSGGAVVGKAWVMIDKTVVNQILGDLSRDGFLYTVFAIVIGALLAGVVIRSMTVHLNRLMIVAEAVRLGDRGKRAEIKGSDELGRLGHAFDSMLDTLEKNEVSLEKAKADANKASVAKGEFLANMSHEIRTPMNGIIGLVNLALNEPTGPEARGYLTKTASSLKTLLGVLNDILDFSKLEVGRMRLENSVFSFAVVMENLRLLYEDNARQKGLEFRIEVAEEVPSFVIGDALRIQQVLSNLLANAIKFTDRGQVLLRVKNEKAAGASVELGFSIEDTGIGIPSEAIERLIQPFSQADNSITRRFGGTGLGLAISRSLLELMDAKLQVNSVPGEGSKVSFNLNLGVGSKDSNTDFSPAAGIVPGQLAAVLKARAMRLKGARILVAEDDQVNQLVIKSILKLAGLEAKIVATGQEAIEAIEQDDFDIVLMDVHMPIVDGIEATKRILGRKKFANVPIIALSAGVTKEERKKCFSAGMRDFISKPFEGASLLEAIEKNLKKKPNVLVSTG
jgi:signal transduction histidine kinase/ActR/RegA family two-component response regulator